MEAGRGLPRAIKRGRLTSHGLKNYPEKLPVLIPPRFRWQRQSRVPGGDDDTVGVASPRPSSMFPHAPRGAKPPAFGHHRDQTASSHGGKAQGIWRSSGPSSILPRGQSPWDFRITTQQHSPMGTKPKGSGHHQDQTASSHGGKAQGIWASPRPNSILPWGQSPRDLGITKTKQHPPTGAKPSGFGHHRRLSTILPWGQSPENLGITNTQHHPPTGTKPSGFGHHQDPAPSSHGGKAQGIWASSKPNSILPRQKTPGDYVARQTQHHAGCSRTQPWCPSQVCPSFVLSTPRIHFPCSALTANRKTTGLCV